MRSQSKKGRLVKWALRGVAALCVTLPAISLATAAGMTVGAGGSICLGSGVWNLGCKDLLIQDGGALAVDRGRLVQRHMENQAAGTLDGGSGSIEVFGDWKNQGNFFAGTGTVSLIDGCGLGTTNIRGESAFCNLVIASSAGKTVYFEAGMTQGVTCAMDFSGESGNLLVIRSSVPGNQAFIALAPAASQNHDHEKVADMAGTAQFIAPGPPESYNSEDAGGNSRWFDRIPPIPTLSQLGFALFAAFILLAGCRVLRRSRPAP